MYEQESVDEFRWYEWLWQLLQVLPEQSGRGRWAIGPLEIGVAAALEGRAQPFRQARATARQAEHRRALESICLDVAAQTMHHERHPRVAVALEQVQSLAEDSGAARAPAQQRSRQRTLHPCQSRFVLFVEKLSGNNFGCFYNIQEKNRNCKPCQMNYGDVDGDGEALAAVAEDVSSHHHSFDTATHRRTVERGNRWIEYAYVCSCLIMLIKFQLPFTGSL